jgi:hypothetical protein
MAMLGDVASSGGRLHFGMVAGSNRNLWPDCLGIRIRLTTRVLPPPQAECSVYAFGVDVRDLAAECRGARLWAPDTNLCMERTVTAESPSRRDVIALAAATVPAALAVSVAPASAYQGNMERALAALNEALVSLEESTPNKGGHREHAIDLVRGAMHQVQMGIDFANRHGGGGAM